jgi:general secretion pathway protein C
MKRWPIFVSFVLFVGLCASATFWAMQLFKPATRPVAIPKSAGKPEVGLEAALGLFGGRAMAVAAVSNFQLKGVVVAKNALESIAILVADSKPAEAVRVNAEVIPGVTVKEVHSQYVLLLDGGVVKRVELPSTASPTKVDSPLGATPQIPAAAPTPTSAGAPPPPPPNPAGQGDAQSPANTPRTVRLGGHRGPDLPNSN